MKDVFTSNKLSKEYILKGDEMKTIINIIKSEFPDITVELSEGLELVRETLTILMDDISAKASKSFQDRDIESIEKYKKLIEEGSKYENLIVDYINLLDIESNNKDMTNKGEEQRSIPNYDDYKVDNHIVYGLSDDWVHKRPYGFKFLRNETYKVNLWKEVLIKTCEILYEIDPIKFNNFENVPYMNGKRKKHFAKDPNELRREHRIKDGIYIETNHSANFIRKKIARLLKEYGFKTTDFKVYFRADYTELNKNN